MQLSTPRVVAIAVSIAASVWRMNFHVSFFIFTKQIRGLKIEVKSLLAQRVDLESKLGVN